MSPRPPVDDLERDDLDELKRRLGAFVRRVDLAGEIAARPWESVAMAAMAGAAFGFARPRAGVDNLGIRDRLVDVALSALGALALRAVRDSVVRRLSDAAKRWWGESASGPVRAEIRARRTESSTDAMVRRA